MASYKIKIAARLRPALPDEIVDDCIAINHTANDPTTSPAIGSYISVVNPRDTSQVFNFSFSSCYDQDATQEEIFRNDVDPLLDIVYSGVTVTVFAYGVTSSGKTHTMQGTKSDPGIIPRVVQALFERQNQHHKYQTSFSMSYMELYKDEPYDLLVTRENAPKLPVREDGNGMVFVANLSSVPISSVQEFDSIYNQATKNRSIGATNLNRASSRSHAILTIELRLFEPTEQKVLVGKINLVDLAGSENNKLTGNDPSRMAESKAINQSLSVLGQVVHALNQAAPRIPYRNSKLTRLLQDALGGTSVGLLICNLAPGVKFRQDTLNTLNFATRTKNVENKPVVNERDNRPTHKPHLAAVAIQQPSAPKPAPTVLQTITTAGLSSGTASGKGRSRLSLLPTSKFPRVSSIGSGNNATLHRFAVPRVDSRNIKTSEILTEKPSQENDENRSGNLGLELLGMTEKEIEQKIMKVVEAEVAKRLAEERKRQEEERQAKEKERIEAEKAQSSPKKSGTLPSGVLTPLLERHRDLDEELRTRLHDLERKFEQGNREASLVDTLSPVSRKKTGRAYVSLARAYSEKGKLGNALELYRRAEAYVPDNVKLKERIIELEWAVKNKKEFIPSPKRNRRSRKPKKKKAYKEQQQPLGEHGEPHTEIDRNVTKNLGSDSYGSQPADFGVEITNTRSPNVLKRSITEVGDRPNEGNDHNAQTPTKKQKLENVSVDDDNWIPPAPMKGKKAVTL